MKLRNYNASSAAYGQGLKLQREVLTDDVEKMIDAVPPFSVLPAIPGRGESGIAQLPYCGVRYSPPNVRRVFFSWYWGGDFGDTYLI